MTTANKPIGIRRAAAAVHEARDPKSPSGKSISSAEWKTIQTAVESDLFDAKMLPLGAPMASDAKSAMRSLSTLALREGTIVRRTENVAEDVLKALAKVGPHTAKVISDFQKGRSVDSADKGLMKVLSTLQAAIDEARDHEKRAKGGLDAATKTLQKLTAAQGPQGHVEALNKAYTGFKLGDAD